MTRKANKKVRKPLWRCPACGEPMKVSYTQNKGGFIAIRKRICTNKLCNKSIQTVEKQKD